MVNPVTLDSRAHRNLRVSRYTSPDAAQVDAVSVIPREFQRLVAHYPIFFVKSSDSGRFEPVALLGFQKKENLFFVDGRWDVAYVPLQIQRLPFSLLSGQGSFDVAIDMSSPQVQTEAGERLFEDDGQPSKYLQNVISMLSALVSGSAEGYAFTARLAELNLLEPVKINIEFVDRSEASLEGLYWISSAALKALPAAQLAELRDREFLEWLYFQIASVSHVSGLVARRNQLLSGGVAERPAGRESPVER
ncbi:MAG TPA: SapC family protein [Steroidobacteraceae bacterium]